MNGKLRVALVLAAAAGIGFGSGLQSAGVTRLSFVAIGQGDCVVLQHQGYVVMVDAGGKLPEFDAAQRIGLPELRKLGIEKIDLLILSHPDADHVGGLYAFSRRFPIGRVVASADFRRHEEMLAWLERGRISPDDVAWVDKAAMVKLGSARIDIFNPGWNPAESANEGSMIVRLAIGRGSALLTGDAGQPVEARLARTGDWRSQILKAGHHGSQTSTSSRWLREVQAEWVIISCGRGNQYGHPNDGVMDRIASSGARIARTDRDGTIRFRVGPTGFELER